MLNKMDSNSIKQTDHTAPLLKIRALLSLSALSSTCTQCKLVVAIHPSFFLGLSQSQGLPCPSNSGMHPLPAAHTAQ